MHMTRSLGNALAIAAAIGALVLSSIACGSSASPTKVGELPSSGQVGQSTTAGQPTAASEPTSMPAQQATNTPAGPVTYKVGDVIQIGDSSMVVLGWSQPEGDQFNKPEAGDQFVAVDVLLVNTGSSAAHVSSFLQMTLKDETGQKYNPDLMASTAAGSSAPDGELSPGERIRGKVGFQVPEDAAGLTFVFDADVFGTGKVFVNLGAEPISVEPPSDLMAGEQEQETFAIGDVIQIGDSTLTVNSADEVPGSTYNKPDTGNKFIVVDLTIQNNSSDSAAISSLLQMSLKDSTGQKYEVDLMAQVASGGTSPDGELAPGEKVRGQVAFQVPEDATGLVFVFDADVFGTGKVFVSLE
jgi:hypothetical protein